MIVPGSTIDIEIFSYAIRHAQISSLISKKVTSGSAFQKTAEELIKSVSEIDQQLQEWRNSMPIYLQPGRYMKTLGTSTKKNKINIIYIYFSYYGSLMAMHTIFAYPWITTSVFHTDLDSSPAFLEQVPGSIKKVAEAARSIILLTRYIEMDAVSPWW